MGKEQKGVFIDLVGSLGINVMFDETFLYCVELIMSMPIDNFAEVRNKGIPVND